MNNERQKIENSLNLALDATEEERGKTLDLNVGYDRNTDRWDVIVKYSGDNLFSALNIERSQLFQVVELLNRYAIITTSSAIIEQLSVNEQIEFIEKPKRLFFEQTVGEVVSCITSVQRAPYDLQGEGVIIGVLDSGIDYRNMEFRNPDGTTRIRGIWDQTINGVPPDGYIIGTEYTSEQINKDLLEERVGVSSTVEIVTRDLTGHGTEVTSIAAGNSGVASKAEIIMVKLGTSREKGFPRTTELMQGLDYLVRKALEYEKPMAVNISFGNTYGAHDGSSLIERFIDDLSTYGKISICIGSGNEGNASGHISGRVKATSVQAVELAVERREVSLNLQIWKLYEDYLEIALISPQGVRVGPIKNRMGTQRYIVGETEILLYNGRPSPYNILQEIYVEFIPLETYIDSGVWKIEMTPIEIVTGEYDMWLPTYGILNEGTQFLQPTKVNTITIPGTAQRAISVGAYDARTFTYADFSGRGSIEIPRYVKPDVVAPGVKVSVSSVGGITKEVSGTSFATPFVTGGAALLLEWGVVRGNDTYLYGEKLKAFLRKGAKPLPGMQYKQYPNASVGYGSICIEDSI